MRQIKKHLLGRRITAFTLCLCMIMSLISGVGLFRAVVARAAGGTSVPAGGPTSGVIDRVADENTMDDYINKLLTEENGSRYAGRVWTDKTVVAYGAEERNRIPLDMATDGYVGGVTFNADFAHVFSALASSQVVHEYPPQPLDVMFVVDVSGSMGQIGTEKTLPEEGGFNQTPIYKTVDAINGAIELLLKENPNSRIGIVVYGSTAAVLVPLGHYTSCKLLTTYIEKYGTAT